MQLGMIGLGRMGGNMVRRLLKGGHQCVVYNRSANAVAELVKEKAVGTTSLPDRQEAQQAARILGSAHRLAEQTSDARSDRCRDRQALS